MTDDKIDDLAGMVKRGFDAASKEINGVRDDLVIGQRKSRKHRKFHFSAAKPQN